MKSRSVAAAVSVVAITTLGISACTSSKSSSAPKSGLADKTAPAQAAACSGTPVSGGTLTLAKQNQTLSLSPYKTPGGYGDGEAQNMMLQGLVAMDPTGKTTDIVGAISDKWTISPDGLTYSFHLRSGVTFSNGQSVTGEDVKSSLDMWADPKQDQWASFSTGYESTTVVDASDVKIQLSAPTGGFLNSLAMAAAVITPANLVKAQGNAFWNKPIGTGPFMLDSWTKGSSISFVKNPHYWQSGQPLLDKVVFNFVSDDNTRVLDLRNGQAQVIDSVPYTQVDSLTKTSGLTVTPYKIPSWVLLSLNNKKAELSDVNVRKALDMAIDRDAINKKIYHGLATTPNSILPALKYDADDSVVPAATYDMSKAKSLMSKSKYPKGFTATLEYPSSSPAFASLALVLQSEWASLGVKVTLRAEDQATLSKNFTGGTYDMILPYALAVSDVVIPDEFAGFYAVPGSTNGFYSWWSDPSIAAMVTTFEKASDAERAVQWPKIQAAMLAQQPVINVLDLPYLVAQSTKVCSNNLSPIGYESLAQTWIAK